MTQLNERERHILTARRLSERPIKLDELAANYGVSRERIRQIEDRAFTRIQEALGLVPPRPRRTIEPIWLPQSLSDFRSARRPSSVCAAQARVDQATRPATAAGWDIATEK